MSSVPFADRHIGPRPADVEAMLRADFARATRFTQADLAGTTFPFRLAAQGTRLLAPVL